MGFFFECYGDSVSSLDEGVHSKKKAQPILLVEEGTFAGVGFSYAEGGRSRLFFLNRRWSLLILLLKDGSYPAASSSYSVNIRRR